MYYPHQWLQKKIQLRGWRFIGLPSDRYLAINGKTSMLLSSYYCALLIAEWSDRWPKAYLPKEGIEDKTILDVGAGNGETAYFFFKHGARRVVCVESDAEARKILTQNIMVNDWYALVADFPFHPSLLKSYDYDFVKFDCEGCEGDLFKRFRHGNHVERIFSREQALAEFATLPVDIASGDAHPKDAA